MRRKKPGGRESRWQWGPFSWWSWSRRRRYSWGWARGNAPRGRVLGILGNELTFRRPALLLAGLCKKNPFGHCLKGMKGERGGCGQRYTCRVKRRTLAAASRDHVHGRLCYLCFGHAAIVSMYASLRLHIFFSISLILPFSRQIKRKFRYITFLFPHSPSYRQADVVNGELRGSFWAGD